MTPNEATGTKPEEQPPNMQDLGFDRALPLKEERFLDRLVRKAGNEPFVPLGAAYVQPFSGDFALRADTSAD